MNCRFISFILLNLSVFLFPLISLSCPEWNGEYECVSPAGTWKLYIKKNSSDPIQPSYYVREHSHQLLDPNQKILPENLDREFKVLRGMVYCHGNTLNIRFKTNQTYLRYIFVSPLVIEREFLIKTQGIIENARCMLTNNSGESLSSHSHPNAHPETPSDSSVAGNNTPGALSTIPNNFGIGLNSDESHDDASFDLDQLMDTKAFEESSDAFLPSNRGAPVLPTSLDAAISTLPELPLYQHHPTTPQTEPTLQQKMPDPPQQKRQYIRKRKKAEEGVDYSKTIYQSLEELGELFKERYSSCAIVRIAKSEIIRLREENQRLREDNLFLQNTIQRILPPHPPTIPPH